MILGDTCTRRCGFCNVKTGKPTHNDPLEPLRVAQSVRKMGLRHAVITSVDRDDLPDLGAFAFVGVIRSIRRMAPGCKVEVLTPDFRGEEMPLARVIAERPDVFNHNVETVPRLYPLARRGSRFLRSCRVLRNAKEMGGDEVVTKSGLMTGLGESKEELLDAFGTLREHGVQVLTVGQYLRPTRDHLPVVRYWHPDEFAELEREAYAMGFELGGRRTARALELPRRTDARAGRLVVTAAARLAIGAALVLAAGGAAVVLAAGPSTGDARTDRWTALAPAPLERTEVAAARIGRSIYVVGGFEERSGATSAAVERYDIRRNRWSRVRAMPIAVNHATAVAHRGRPLRARRLHGRERPERPDRRADALRPRAQALAPAARLADPARGPRAGRARRPPLRRGRRERHRLAALARDLRHRAPSLDERPELPVRPGAQPHDRGRRGRALLRDRGPRRRELHGGRALRPAPARVGGRAGPAHAARRHRRGAPRATGASSSSEARTSSPAAPRSRTSSSSTRARARGAACRRCARRGTGSAERRSATACTRSKAASSRASRSRTRSRRSTSASRAPVRPRVPAQGQHPDAPLPGGHARDRRDLHGRLVRIRGELLEHQRDRQRARGRVRRDPLRDHPPGRRVRGRRHGHADRLPGPAGRRRARLPTRRPGG